MELNEKCIEMLQYMREKNDFVTTRELADIYNITERAIRYNLDKIEKFLVKNNFDYFERQHNKGVKLSNNEKLKQFINSFVSKHTPYKYVYSKDERFKLMLVDILQANKPIKLSHFETMLCISRNTVLKEMDSIEKWLKERKMTLIRKPKVGVFIEGGEQNKRKAILELTSNAVSTEEVFKHLNKKVSNSKLNNLQFNILFSDLDIRFIDSLIKNAEKELGKEFSDEAYSSLITHIALMIKRIQLGKEIYIPEIQEDSIKNGIEHEAAKNIIHEIEKKYNINIPSEEVSYITLHLLGARVLKTDKIFSGNDYSSDDLYNITEKMTEEIEQIYDVNFGQAKSQVIEGLVMHLRPSIYRIKFNLKLENPLLNEIRTNYSELFKNTKYVLRNLEEYIGSKICDEEVSYVTLHFGAAVKNAKDLIKSKAKIILVCGTGIGTSKMLASQIASEFDVEVIDTISCRAVNSLKGIDYDFIISTVEIPDYDTRDYIKISPLLLNKDYEKLKQYLQLNYKSKKGDEYEYEIVNRLIGIVEKYCDIKDKQHLQYEFLYEFKKVREYMTERRKVYMLNDLLNKDFIRVNVECNNWRQAITEGTSLLINKGCIEKLYEDSILKSFEELGPYMVVAPGIVLSHSRPENGVKKLSMSLITLKNPIKFGNETNDPVKLVVTLAAKDNELHLKALSQLMELFMNSEDLNKIINATNKEDILSIINTYSKK